MVGEATLALDARLAAFAANVESWDYLDEYERQVMPDILKLLDKLQKEEQ